MVLWELAKGPKYYMEAARQLESFLIVRGMPTNVQSVTREHIEFFLIDVRDRTSASSEATRYLQLQQFFRWLLEDGEIAVSPMARMRPPQVAEKQVPVIPEADIIKLLDACAGRDFEDRRDVAIIRMLLGTGARLSEIANLTVDDLDLDIGEASVTGKGNRPRLLALTPKVIKTLDRYIRDRARHKDADLPWLWLGPKGTAHRQRHLSDDRAALRASGDQADPPPPVPAHLRSPVALRWRPGAGPSCGSQVGAHRRWWRATRLALERREPLPPTEGSHRVRTSEALDAGPARSVVDLPRHCRSHGELRKRAST
jgi:site-specific recombinase XerC